MQVRHWNFHTAWIEAGQPAAELQPLLRQLRQALYLGQAQLSSHARFIKAAAVLFCTARREILDPIFQLKPLRPAVETRLQHGATKRRMIGLPYAHAPADNE